MDGKHDPYAAPAVDDLARPRGSYDGDDAGVILVRRPLAWFGLARRMKVTLDRSEVGRLKTLGEVALRVPPGTHLLSVGMDWCRAHRRVDVSAGEVRVLSARVAFLPLALVFTIFAPNKVFWLEPLET